MTAIMQDEGLVIQGKIEVTVCAKIITRIAWGKNMFLCRHLLSPHLILSIHTVWASPAHKLALEDQEEVHKLKARGGTCARILHEGITFLCITCPDNNPVRLK